MKLLMIDNYDSFTFNLVQYLGELGAEVDVYRNDAAKPDELLDARPDGVTTRWSVVCDPPSLAGEAILIDGLLGTQTDIAFLERMAPRLTDA